MQNLVNFYVVECDLMYARNYVCLIFRNCSVDPLENSRCTLHHSALFDVGQSLIYSVPHSLATAPTNSSATYGA